MESSPRKPANTTEHAVARYRIRQLTARRLMQSRSDRLNWHYRPATGGTVAINRLS
jgi:hypothetical protein